MMKNTTKNMMINTTTDMANDTIMITMMIQARWNNFKATGTIQSLLSYQDNISKHNQYSNGGLKGTDKNEVYEIEKSTSSSF